MTVPAIAPPEFRPPVVGAVPWIVLTGHWPEPRKRYVLMTPEQLRQAQRTFEALQRTAARRKGTGGAK